MNLCQQLLKSQNLINKRMSEASPQVSQAMKPGTSESFYGPTIILFILMALLSGSILKQVNKKWGLPYSPMLLILGLILGTYHESLGEWGRASFLIEHIHPHTGISIFVPTLMFTGALGANFYMFRKSITNILILSVPGVIIGSLLFAFVLRSILGYTDADMTWYQALTLGCALSSTDPVAVVTLLKQLGSSGRFNTLIEGQSLVSGAVSMILYYLFLDVANGETTNAVQFTWQAVRLTAGGVIVGLLFGVVVSIWMKRIIRDHTLSIVITIIGSYLSFYVCEFTWLKFGGVAAVVIQGLYLAAVVKRKIYPESQQALDTVWSTMAYSGMTVLFVLGGVIAGVEFSNDHTLTTEDWVKMFAFWALMIVVRAIVIYGFYPILKSRGYGLSKKELLVLIYGGLKGGLGLSLAMMITVDPYYPIRFRQLATFYMGGMVVLTVIINGLSCKKILDYIEIIHVPEIKLKLFKRCVKEVLKATQGKFEELKTEPDLAYAKWKDVEGIADIHKLGEVERERQEHAMEVEMRDSLINVKESDMIEEIRFRFTRYLSKIYWNFYEEGELSQEGIKILSQSCDVANDSSQQKLKYFEQLTETFALDTVRVYTHFKDWALIGPFFTRMLVSKIYFVYQVAAIFTEACEETVRVFKNDFPINNDQLNEVVEEVKENVDQAIAYINDLESNFPDVITAVHTRRAATIVLKNKKNSLKKMHEEGFIDDLQYQTLRKEIDVNLVGVHLTPLKLEELRVNEVLIDCPLFSTLSKPEIARIKSKSTERTFNKDKTIISMEGEINTVYILLSGSVREQFDNFYLIKSTGSVINPYDLTLKKDSRCSVKALNNVKVMELRPEVIEELIASNPEFKKKWYKTLFIYESHLNKNLQFLHKTLSEKQFRRFVEAAQIRLLKSGEKDYVQSGAYLIEGQLDCEGSTYTQNGSIIPREKMLKALTDCVTIKFNQITGLNVADTLRVSNLKEEGQK